MTREVLQSIVWIALLNVALSSLTGYLVGALTWPAVRRWTRRVRRALRDPRPDGRRDRDRAIRGQW